MPDMNEDNPIHANIFEVTDVPICKILSADVGVLEHEGACTDIDTSTCA
jgi:hypothetical protein